MEELLQSGADIDARSQFRTTPIVVACYEENWSAVSLLGCSALRLSLPSEDIACDLIEAGIPTKAIAADGMTPLLTALTPCSAAAIRVERLGIARDFVARGCFRCEAREPLDSTSQLIEEDKHREEEHKVALTAFRRDTSHVNETIAPYKGPNSTDTLSGALFLACSRGFTNIDEPLIKHGAVVHSRDPNPQIPLHYALPYRHIEAANYLILKGASPTMEDSIGSTPLDLAVTGGLCYRDFTKKHIAVLIPGRKRQPSLPQHVRQGKGIGGISPSRIGEMLTEKWEGQYKYLGWSRDIQEPFSIEVPGEPFVEAAKYRTRQDGSSPSLEVTLASGVENGEDQPGKFEILGFVWFVKLCEAMGWLYGGQLRGDTGGMRGTWASNRQLWHGGFHLKKVRSCKPETQA
ncbi:putative Ankyrin [Seiridium cardinale]|uniref:Ankyrin n=1 Tax=Seiridium cardinale TaxID=138064 RepID=A0ABR2XTD9_9PEZI